MDVGQVLLLKIDYADGGKADKKRPLLIYNIDNNYIYAFNVSSVNGKINKILYECNLLIKRYNPPLKLKSFVKIDSVYVIENLSELSSCLANKGKKLVYDEIDYITRYYIHYKKYNTITRKFVTRSELVMYKNIKNDSKDFAINEQQKTIDETAAGLEDK